MKKLIFLGLGLLLWTVPSRAQSADVSVGYSYFRLGNSGGLNQNGVSGSIAYHPNDWLGYVGDFGGYHGSLAGVSLNTYTFMFGPRVSLHNPTKFTPFVQGLLGAGHQTFGGGSSNQFAYSFGGGVDFGLLPHLGLRPQLDYVGLHNGSGTANCTRVSASFVIHF